jgi:hypothetical protein
MPSTPRTPRTRVTLGAVACLAILLTGCGKSGEPDATAGGGSSASGAGSGSTGTLDQQRSAWEARFRSCLSGKGFELPKDGKIDFGDRQAAYEAAEDACLKKVGQPPTGGKGSAEDIQKGKEKMLRSVQCLRKLGYKIDDPKDNTLHIPTEVTQKDLNACVKP